MEMIGMEWSDSMLSPDDVAFAVWAQQLIKFCCAAFASAPAMGTLLEDSDIPDDTICTWETWNTKVDTLLTECHLEEGKEA